jgi:hypothetical protein
MRRKHRQEFVALAQAYRGQIADLQSQVRRLEARLEANSVARTKAHRDGFSQWVHVTFELRDPRVHDQEIGRYIAESVARQLLALPDYRNDLREYAETGRTWHL